MLFFTLVVFSGSYLDPIHGEGGQCIHLYIIWKKYPSKICIFNVNFMVIGEQSSQPLKYNLKCFISGEFSLDDNLLIFMKIIF